MKRTAGEIICPIQDPGQWSFLKRRFRLSSAETYVAIKICQAFNVGQIAGRRNRSANTVRRQRESIRAKTDTRNDVELLTTFLMALRWEADNAYGG